MSRLCSPSSIFRRKEKQLLIILVIEDKKLKVEADVSTFSFLFLPVTKKSQLDFRYIRDKETEIYFLIDKIKSL